MSLKDHRVVYESGNPGAYEAKLSERAVSLHEDAEIEAELQSQETGASVRATKTTGLGDVLSMWLRSNPVDAKILAYRVTHGLEFSEIALLVGKSRRAVEERWRRMLEKCADPSLLS